MINEKESLRVSLKYGDVLSGSVCQDTQGKQLNIDDAGIDSVYGSCYTVYIS